MNIYIDGIIYSLQKGGGVTRYTDELINGLIKKGNNVFVIEHSKTANPSLRSKKAKIINIDSPLRVDNRIFKLITYPIHKYIVNRFLKDQKINEGIFHSTYFTYYKDLKIPQVLTIHDLTREKFPKYFNYIYNKIFIYITRKYLNKANAVVCVSKQTTAELIKYYKDISNKITITPLGVDSFFITKGDSEKSNFIKSKGINKKYILFVGRRSIYKNFKKILEAFSVWSKKDEYDIVTVGGGNMTEEEKKLIKNLKIEKSIKSYNFVTEQELVMFYNCAHSFIFPSLSEGFGLPILEAMACSTQILVSDIPVFREIADNVPYYFNPDNTESIIEALNNSIKIDKNKINDGLELVKNYTWENTINKTIEVYNKLNNN